MTQDNAIALAPRQRTTLVVGTALLAVLSVLAWWMFQRALAVKLVELGTSTVWPVLAATFALFFLVLALAGTMSAVVQNRWTVRSLHLAIPAAYLLLFGPSVLHLLATLLLMLGLWHFDEGIAAEARDRRTFSMRKSLRPSMNGMLTAMLLAMSLTFYGTVVQRTQLQSPVDALARTAAGPLNQILEAQVAGYNTTLTLDQFVLAQAMAQFGGQEKEGAQGVTNVLGGQSDVLAPYVERVPEATRMQLQNDPIALERFLTQQFGSTVSQQVAQARSTMLAQFGIQAKGNEPMSEVVTHFLSQRLRSWLGPYAFLLPPLLALSFFFSLSIFIVLYHFCIAALAGALFALCRRLRLADITAQQATVQGASLTTAP